MEMPDVIYAAEYFDIDSVSLKEWREKSLTGSEKYHHYRVVEALKAENAELKNSIEILGQKLRDYSKAIDRLDVKLEKAKDCLGQISRMTTLPDHASNTATLVASHTLARTTLEEIG